MQFRNAQRVYGRRVVLSALICIFVFISSGTFSEEDHSGFVVKILSKGVQTRPIHMRFINSDPDPSVEQNLMISKPTQETQSILSEQTIYKGIYPGINLVHYKNAGKIFNDLVITPAGDPDTIRIVYEGFENVELFAELPAYQVVQNVKVHIPVDMTRMHHGVYKLRVGNYDPEFDLVIPTTSVPIHARSRSLASIQ